MARTDSTKSSVCASGFSFWATNSTGTKASNQSRGLRRISLSKGFMAPRGWEWQLSRQRFILPVDPIDLMRFTVAGDGCLNSREERLFAKKCEQPETLQLVFDWILELGKTQFYAFVAQCFMQF